MNQLDPDSSSQPLGWARTALARRQSMLLVERLSPSSVMTRSPFESLRYRPVMTAEMHRSTMVSRSHDPESQASHPQLGTKSITIVGLPAPSVSPASSQSPS